MSSVSKRSTQVRCQLPAHVGELASLFRWFESNKLNLRRIEVQSIQAPHPQFMVQLEMDAPRHFPGTVESLDEVKRLVKAEYA